MCYCYLDPKTSYAICWFFILITVAFPIAFISAPLYILFSPFSVCYDCCEDIVDYLLCGIQLPYRATKGIATGETFCLIVNPCDMACWRAELCEPPTYCCATPPKPKKKKKCCCDPPEHRICCDDNPDHRARHCHHTKTNCPY